MQIGSLPDNFDRLDLPFSAIPGIWTNIAFLVAKSATDEAWSIKPWYITDGLPDDFGSSFLVLRISNIFGAELAKLSNGPSPEWSNSAALIDALDELSARVQVLIDD